MQDQENNDAIVIIEKLKKMEIKKEGPFLDLVAEWLNHNY